MGAAKRNGEFIANFAAKCGRLRKSQVVGIAGLTAANNARLGRDKRAVLLVTMAERFGHDGALARAGEGFGRLGRGWLAGKRRRRRISPVTSGAGGGGLLRYHLSEPCLEALFDRPSVLGRQLVLRRQAAVCQLAASSAV